jgi:hypothetical protein
MSNNTEKYESPNIVVRMQEGSGSASEPNSLYAHDTGTYTVEDIEALGFELPGGFAALDEERDNELDKFLWASNAAKGGQTFTLNSDDAFSDIFDDGDEE